MTLPPTVDDSTETLICFWITGRAAHSRLVPLLPADWVDTSPFTAGAAAYNAPHLLWENAPQKATRAFRDTVACYSHLPNGTAILDNKWVLARLQKDALEALETHCFYGQGFVEFCQKVNLWRPATAAESTKEPKQWKFCDLTEDSSSSLDIANPPPPDNWWVIKDACSNGAGGIWMASPHNVAELMNTLHDQHAYVAQRYAWPPVLYGGRKCHVRVYGLLTSDGCAFVHTKAFLHVANQKFDPLADFTDDMHITNCCANSHEPTQFAGEICADLQANTWYQDDNVDVVPLAEYAPSIYAALAQLARKAFPFVLPGSQRNHGFEYLGLDFILSRDKHNKPMAYLLEVNAPPSQDTATGLPHAEKVHDTVLRDLIHLWILPCVCGVDPIQGGWRKVYQQQQDILDDSSCLSYSKAVMLNKIRWALYERKLQKQQQLLAEPVDTHDELVRTIRTYFPYYNNSSSSPIFMENAGGSQVPIHVMSAVQTALSCRDRSVVGLQSTIAARDTVRMLLGASAKHSIQLGSNASTLLQALASAYTRTKLLTVDSEVIISIENHQANVNPWLQAAESVGATVKWWSPLNRLQDLVSCNTRVVAISHASNLLGQVRDLAEIQQIVSTQSMGRAHLVVDGVAAVPHVFANVKAVDWYVVSFHKMFGPHIGALCGKTDLVEQLGSLEVGTLNYEACQGLVGLGYYFSELSLLSTRKQPDSQSFPQDDDACQVVEDGASKETTSRRDSPIFCQVSPCQERVQDAYRLIHRIELPLTRTLLKGLQSSPKVQILQTAHDSEAKTIRLPVVCFVHADIPCETIVQKCREAGVQCRCGTFLSTDRLLSAHRVNNGVVRFSLAHYNTLSEVRYALKVLESIPGWY